MVLILECDTCRHRHVEDYDVPAHHANILADWYAKHTQHEGVRVRWPQRSLATDRAALPQGVDAYLHNADVKIAYGTSFAPTITLASLAASSTLLAGRESSAISNNANKYHDILLSGFYRTAGTNLQAGRIRTHVVAALNDTPAWPDVFDGTDSTETVSATGIYDATCRVVSEIATDTTQRTWAFSGVPIAQWFGGRLPRDFVLFVSHDAHTSTNAWSATEADHGLSLMGIYYTVI